MFHNFFRQTLISTYESNCVTFDHEVLTHSVHALADFDYAHWLIDPLSYSYTLDQF